jgi:hypothetical protein
LRVAKELCMPTFLVCRQMPGLTRDQHAAAQQAVNEEARQASIGGRVVCLLGDFFLPAKGGAICIFRAESLVDVAAINERAGVPFTEIPEAIELRPREEA